jgi:IPT/TIG domain/Bacterial Ig-like domain (group 2)/Galactose oxidase, central domain/Kelch motif
MRQLVRSKFVLGLFFLLSLGSEAWAAAPTITSLSITTGAVGASVTVTGTNFGSPQGTSTIKFNGTTATATTWTTTSIVTTVPTGATTGNVVVTVSGTASNGKSFTVVAAPSITSLSITTGAVGAAVTVTGTSFGSTQGSGTVKFNGTTASVTTWSATSIAVTVPGGATTGNVVVFASGVNSNGKSFTVVSAPSITSLSITTGAIGAAVTVTGTNFGSSQGTGTVKFNGTTATVSTWSATSIAVTVPTGATTGNVVVFASGVNSNGSSFTVVAAPSITSLSITSGAVGAAVTVTGTNFGSSQGTSTVKFNGTTATVSTWSATSIAVTVPTGATTGNVVVHASGVDSNGKSFTVLPTPNITSLSITTGAVGASVTVTGTNFGSPQGTSTIKFNGTTATATTWTTTSIVTTVPTAATTGNVVVNVGGVNSAGVNFTVVPAPGITSLSITTGAVGAAVTVTGTNFGSTQGSGTVKFNGTTASVTTWSATSIAVTVPTGATTGNVVVFASGVNSNGSSFTVVAAPSITSLSITTGAVGAAVTVTGTSFGSSQGTSTVKFNGTTATVSTWSATSIAVTVPSGATTGNVVVHASGVDSNGKSFTVLPTPSITSLSITSGAVGASVTVTGTNFGSPQGTSIIKFNGTTATATTWTTTSIVTTVPSGATTGNVVVTVSGVASNGSSFTVLTLVSISVTPQSPVVTVGNSQQFTATGTYSDNSTQNLTATATWTSLVSGVAAVNASGLATAASSGTTTIQAKVGTISGSTSLVVPGFAPTGSLTTARNAHRAVLLSNGNVLVVGGFDISGNALASAELYNPATGSFTATGRLNFVRTSFSTTLLVDGTVLIAGGDDSGGNLLSSAELYNPVTGTFTLTGGMVSARAYHSATLLANGKVLLAGSFDNSGNVLVSAELYDPSTQTFIPTGNLNTARGLQTANLLNDGTVLIAGGIASGSYLASAEVYSPVTGTFSVVGSLNAARIQDTATLLNNGTVLIAGGQDINGNTLASAELYNPIARTFALTGVMNAARGNHAATLLNNGTVLVEGGFTTTADMSASAEIYDPVAASFTATANLNTARQIQTATLLTTGAVLVAGGFSDNAAALASAELYQAATFVPANLVSIAVTPVSSSVPTGTSQGLTATGTFSDNSTQSLASATWSSSNNSVATVSNDSANHGVANAVAAGITTISACTGSICGSTTVTVVAPDPDIDALSPSSGPVGAQVTISGEGYGAIQGASRVTVDGVPATTTSWSPASIVVTVPAGVTTGNVTVYVSGVGSNLAQFTVLPTPAIATLTPASGDVGVTVDISGSNFGDTQGTSTLTLAGTPISVTSWSATDITGTVPAGAASGNVVVTVGGVASNSVSFTVLGAPEIFSLSPVLGPPGTSVTISGNAFGNTQGASTVSFNGVAATITGWSNTSVTSVVPTGATTGPVIVNVGGTASNGFTFLSPGPPNISSLSPLTAPVGAPVVIDGTNFGSAQGASVVSFNGAIATVTSWSDTQISVIVPSAATSGIVSVTASGVTGTAAFFTVYTGPIVTSLNPDAGIVGMTLIIRGWGFGATQSTSTVTLNGLVINPGSPTGWTDHAIGIVIPNGATTGPLIVTVFGMSTSPGTFTVYPIPQINSISPAFGVAGTPITINGSAFGNTEGVGGVIFAGGLPLQTATSWSDTQIIVPVPVGAFSGSVGVFASANGYQVTANSNPVAFAVVPSITSVSPNAGTVGTSVQINGNGFGYDQSTGNVAFNGTPANPVSWSPTQIVTYPPVGATTGNIVVTVGGYPSVGANFTIQPSPAISGLSPSSGVVATVVTVSGSGFGSAQGTSTVTFNGVTAAPTAWGTGSITVPVPTGATTGNVVVTVNSVASNGVNFTLDPRPTINSLSQTSGAVGTQITIYGSNFLGSQGTSTVTFNNTAATPTYWDSGTIQVNVPSGATTGNIVVTVLGQASSGTHFTVTAAPSISSLSPTSGPPGQLITVNGSNFGSTQGTSSIAFNGFPATPSTWATGKITVPVAEGATSGAVVVTVNNGPSNGSSFTVANGPGITALSPTAGGTGATVSITGAAFGATQGSSVVKFNGTTATVSSWNDAGIVVSVPVGATNGNVAVTVGGTTSNGISFTVSSTLSVTSVSPTSGNTGEAVTITGTGFGTTQGGSAVTFNGAVASVMSWSNTTIMTTVPSSATSGPVVITVGSAASDGIYFTSQPEILGVSPNPAAAGATLTIAGQNFGATLGNSVIMCNNQPFVAPLVTWSATSIVVQGCLANATQLGPFPVQVTVNGVSSTVAVAQAIPDASLTNETPTIASVGTPILIRGQNLGATQGQSSITINGATATPMSWSNTAIVAPVPSGAASSGQINVTVGGMQAYPWIFGPTVEVLPTPNSLQITPAGVNMVIGDTKQFIVRDDQGRLRYDATWTVDNTSLATITADSSPMLTALAAGTVTLTATAQGVSAQMPVNISALTALPYGTILWSAPPTPGYTPTQVVQTTPTPFGPGSYSIQASGSQTLIQAYTADGQAMWQNTLRPLVGNAVPDGSGGLLTTQKCDNSNPMTLVDSDAVTGMQLWTATITPANGGGNGCPLDAPKIAIRQDGAVAIAAPQNTLPSLMIDGGSSGSSSSTPTIPTSTGTLYDGEQVPLPATMGQPVVDINGMVSEEYAVRVVPYPATTVSSILYLIQITRDGTTTTTQLASSDNANLFPGPLMPDANGGVLATWTIVPPNPPAPSQPYQAAYVLSGASGATYALPTAPAQVAYGSDGLPVYPALVLGENGTAFATYGTSVQSFDIGSGAQHWNYQSPQGVSSIFYANGGGLTVVDSQSNQTPVDSSGNAGTVVALPSLNLLQPSWMGAWQGAIGGSNVGLATVAAPVMDWGHSFWAAEMGSPAPASSSVEMPMFPPLQSCPGAQTPCTYEALGGAMVALRQKMAGSCTSCAAAISLVGSSFTQQAFSSFLGRTPRFYDGTRSYLKISSVCDTQGTWGWVNWFGCTIPSMPSGCPSSPTVSQYMACSSSTAITATPSASGQGLMTFFVPSSVYLVAASTPTGIVNQSVLFHEGLHGYTGRSDSGLLESFGYNGVTNSSCKITEYLELKIWAGTINVCD